MSRLPDARIGVQLEVKGRAIPFTFHPTVKTNRRFGLQSRLFAANPWSVISQSINEKCPANVKKQALAFLEQAEDFYRSSQSSQVVASKPLLVYYCFLNLAKAFVLQSGSRPEYGAAYHGLNERVPSGGTEFYDSVLSAFPTTAADKPNVFSDFKEALCGTAVMPGGVTYELSHLRAQLLQGHRLWSSSALRQERFIEVSSTKFMHNAGTSEIWINLELFADDLSRFGISRRDLLQKSGLDTIFREVKSNLVRDDRKLLVFEQQVTLNYSGRPSDELKNLVDSVRFKLWATIMRIPPYRKHYLYLCPPNEQSSLLPQILSIWGVFYYLGSVTRYRPQYFDEILSGRFSGHTQEIISNLPQQFLYYMASEFAGREVAHAPLV